jgi:transposase-like protein
LALGSRESYESWLSFGRDLIARGLRSPALVIADRAPGIWKVVRELWPTALEQRCTIHALRNVLGKLPERHHAEVKARWWKLFDEARSASEARQQLTRHPHARQKTNGGSLAEVKRSETYGVFCRAGHGSPIPPPIKA